MSSVSYPSVVEGPDERDANGLRAWPLRTRALVVAAVGIVAMVGIWAAFGLVLDHLLEDTPIVDADERIPKWFEDRRTDTWNSLSYWGSMLSDTFVKVALIALVGLAAMIAWRRWQDALLLAGSVIIEATVFLFSSLIVQRPRPDVEQLDTIPPTGSFPSGHAAAATAFYIALCMIVFWHTRRRWLRGLFVALAIVAPLIVGVSRIERGMHHPIDVLAGFVLGVCSVLLMHRVLQVGTERLRELHDRGEQQIPPQALCLDASNDQEEVVR
jgi:membrane-associated phospholipid phosphatase